MSGAGLRIGMSFCAIQFARGFEAFAQDPDVGVDRLALAAQDPELGYALLQRVTGVMYQRLQAARVVWRDGINERQGAHGRGLELVQ